MTIAYTYSHFRYTSPDSLNNHWLPEIPEHQLEADASYRFLKHFSAGINSRFLTKWHIFTDVKNYDITADGYNVYNCRIAYEWKLNFVKGIISFNINNLSDTKYLSFTEPDPKLYVYNPASGREYFINLKLLF